MKTNSATSADAFEMNFFPLLLLRLMFGLGLAWHGFQTLFLSEKGIEFVAGMVEGAGWPMPTAMAYVAKLAELLCGLMVALGLFTRWSAFIGAFTMATAVYMKAVSVIGDPSRDLAFGDIEMAALYCIAFLALTFTGPGCMSLDHLRGGTTGDEELDDDDLGLPDALEDVDLELEDGPVVDSLDRKAVSSRPTGNPATSSMPPVPPATPDAGSTAPGRGRSGE